MVCVLGVAWVYFNNFLPHGDTQLSQLGLFCSVFTVSMYLSPLADLVNTRLHNIFITHMAVSTQPAVRKVDPEQRHAVGSSLLSWDESGLVSFGAPKVNRWKRILVEKSNVQVTSMIFSTLLYIPYSRICYKEKLNSRTFEFTQLKGIVCNFPFSLESWQLF